MVAVRVGAADEQQLHHRGVALQRGDEQWGGAVRRGGVDRRIRVEQQSRAGCVPFLARHVQRRRASLLACVEAHHRCGTAREQDDDDVGSTVLARHVQRCRASRIGERCVGARREQRRHCIQGSDLARDEQRRGARGGWLVNTCAVLQEHMHHSPVPLARRHVQRGAAVGIRPKPVQVKSTSATTSAVNATVYTSAGRQQCNHLCVPTLDAREERREQRRW